MYESVAYAFAHPSSSSSYVREHAQEMDPEVMKSHIDLYVNGYSLDLGTKGHEAVEKRVHVDPLSNLLNDHVIISGRKLSNIIVL